MRLLFMSETLIRILVFIAFVKTTSMFCFIT